MKTLNQIATDLESGNLKSRDLVEEGLKAIEEPSGEGKRAFITVNAEAARNQADDWDKRRQNGEPVPRYAGVTMGLKDLYDVKGEVTRAGSIVLNDAAPAVCDCPAVDRLRNAGFIFIGRTNMVEFAYGGIGTNPHYGTPLSIYDRETGRVPGGSSSGSAVAVADDMAAIAMGTDTGGSCRIPAAFNGLTGYKPTAARIPTTGVAPLSTSLDSVGPIGRTVECCAAVDGILATDWNGAPKTKKVTDLKLGVLQNFVLADMDTHVSTAFTKALAKLSDAGATLIDITIPVIDDIPEINAMGGIAGAEAWACHRARLENHEHNYDPRVSSRIRGASGQNAADYIDTLHARQRVIQEAHAVTHEFDAVIMPTVAIIPPKLSDVEDDRDYAGLNYLVLRNTAVGNFLDRCAISIPMTTPGDAPAGLMFMGEHGEDEHLFATALCAEQTLGVLQT